MGNHSTSASKGHWRSPVTDPVSRADWLLRTAILLYSMGVAVAIFTRAGSAIGDIALMDFGVPHIEIFFWERVVASVVLLAAASLFLVPTTLALLLVAAVTALEAYAAHQSGGYPYAEYAPLTVALRYLAPVALVSLVVARRIAPFALWRAAITAWVLRVGIAIVFFIHGLEAFWGHPGFIDLILGSARTLFEARIPESTAVRLLLVIGVADMIIAVLILIRPWRPLLAWIAFWGLITALSRPLAYGLAAYPDVLVRSSHFLAPIAVWWIIAALREHKSSGRRLQQPEHIATETLQAGREA